jgi:hypothetical protein
MRSRLVELGFGEEQLRQMTPERRFAGLAELTSE